MRHVLRSSTSTFASVAAIRAISFHLKLARTLTMAASARSYNDAIDALNSLQTPFAVIEARRKAGIRPDANSVREMRGYLARIGYGSADLDRLNIVHVAGTKGKGSTCAFVDSILSRYQAAHGVPSKVGLFTSPHLIAVRERIRIGSRPISEDLFARYFFQVWDRLESSDAAADLVELGTKPIYARYLTLLSYHVFLSEGVEAAVYETGIGGEYDATNVVDRPVAAGISTLGIDHIYVLGDTVDKIAWHKAGIMKPGSPAFTIEQVPAAAEVLRSRAAEKGVHLETLDIDPRLSLGPMPVKIRPDAAFQKKNASLAIALAETVLRKLAPALVPETRDLSAPLPKEFAEGLEQVVWRGRCEVKEEERVVWHIDGAHTVDSLKMAARWFVGECSGKKGPKVLVFNQQGRSEAVDFLDGLCNTAKKGTSAEEDNDGGGKGFEHVIFCTNVTYAETGYKRDFVNHQYNPKDIQEMTAQRAFAERWSALDPSAKIQLIPTIEEAINAVRLLGGELTKDAKDGFIKEDGAGGGVGGVEGVEREKVGEKEGKKEKVQVLITGSLHLVGGALGILEGGVDAL